MSDIKDLVLQRDVEVRKHINGPHLIFRFPNGYGASVIPEYELVYNIPSHPVEDFMPIEGECEIALLAIDAPPSKKYELICGQRYTGFEDDSVVRHQQMDEASVVLQYIESLPTRRGEISDGEK